MNINEALDQLRQSFSEYDWFSDVGLDEYKRPVIYAKRINKEVLSVVPDKIGDFYVYVHFASFKTATREAFVEDKSRTRLFVAPKAVQVEPEKEDEVPPDMAFLTTELDRLERVCGSNILQDIFYETHDGSNAVTNLSARYPDVKEGVQRLYKMYGFDVVYEELDG